MDQVLLAVAGGKQPADLVVKGGKLVNVYSGEIYEGGVAVSNGRIAAVGDVDYAIGPDTKIIDAAGKYITPGFVDGHIHPESSSLSIRPFAEIVLQHGTTAIMTDLHEVGVVAGLEGIEAVLDEAADTDLKLYFVVPSHVPFSPNLETSGGSFNTEIIKKALSRPDAVGLSECVGPYILAGFPELMNSMDAALGMGKSLQGHLPDMVGPALNVCMAAGVSTDHESLGAEDAAGPPALRLPPDDAGGLRRPQPGGVHQAYPGKPHGHLPCLHRHRRPAHLRRGGPRPPGRGRAYRSQVRG